MPVDEYCRDMVQKDAPSRAGFWLLVSFLFLMMTCFLHLPFRAGAQNLVLACQCVHLQCMILKIKVDGAVRESCWVITNSRKNDVMHHSRSRLPASGGNSRLLVSLLRLAKGQASARDRVKTIVRFVRADPWVDQDDLQGPLHLNSVSCTQCAFCMC